MYEIPHPSDFWDPFTFWAQTISNILIAISFLIIPFQLYRLALARKGNFNWVVVLFLVLTLSVGVTRIIDLINILTPVYVLHTLFKIITAITSITTAVYLLYWLPKMLAIPSIAEWQETTRKLKDLNENLERKVEARTQDLLVSSAQFEFLTDAIPQIVWTSNSEGTNDYLNQRWFEYTGSPKTEGLNSSWMEVIHPDDRERSRQAWQKAMREKSIFEIEFRIRRADGEYRWFLSRAIPMLEEDGKIVKWFGSSTDIHDQKLQQAELTRVNEELDSFVYTASHDLKAPISNLEGLLTLIRRQESEVSPEIRKIYGMMQSQIEKFKTTIKDLTDVTRVYRQSVDDFEEVNLEDLCDEFVTSHHEIIRKTNAQFFRDLQVKTFPFSRRLLRSVLHNLLDNALKYRHPERQPEIRLVTCLKDDYLEIEVSDNGIGIPEESKAKIFNMFYRIHSKIEGTGIGLYMIKRIVEKYQGTIDVESELGEGSKFTIKLKSHPQNSETNDNLEI